MAAQRAPLALKSRIHQPAAGGDGQQRHAAAHPDVWCGVTGPHGGCAGAFDEASTCCLLSGGLAARPKVRPPPPVRPWLPDAPQISETQDLTYPRDRSYVMLVLKAALETAPPANASSGASPVGEAVPLVWLSMTGMSLWQATLVPVSGGSLVHGVGAQTTRKRTHARIRALLLGAQELRLAYVQSGVEAGAPYSRSVATLAVSCWAGQT
jgi:hypothetical protein